MSESKKTLREEDIVTERVSTGESVGRRTTLGAIGASVVAMAGVLGAAPEVAEAQCTDSDGGRWADPGGRGRRCRRVRRRVQRTYRRQVQRCTDSDGGRYADRAGAGRRCGGRRSCSDPDGGRWADPAGRGRRC